MNNTSGSTAVIGGPTADTQAGDIVVVVVPPDSNYGVKFTADSDGCAAIIDSFERLPTGKFGPVQKHGGVHAGDVLFEFNDLQLINTKFTEVCRILADKNVLKRELKFMNQKEYYRRKRGNSMRINPIDGKNSFLSTVKRTRISENRGRKFIEYEISCQMRVVGAKIQKEVIYQWSVWRRYSEFLQLHEQLRKSLGWQMNGIEFPPSYWLTFNRLAPEFTEMRREELKDYWQKVISIDKVTEFHKHHCSEELKHFLAVEQNTSGNVAATADMVEEKTEGDAAVTSDGDKVMTSQPAQPNRKTMNRQSSQRRSLLSVTTAKPSATEESNNNAIAPPSPPPSNDAPPPPPPPASAPAPPAPLLSSRSSSTPLPPPPPPSTASTNTNNNNPNPRVSTPLQRSSTQPVPPPNTSTAATPPPEGKTPPKATGARANLLGSINALRKD